MSACSKAEFSSPSNWRTHTHTHTHLHYSHSLQCSVCLLRSDSSIFSALVLSVSCAGGIMTVYFLYEGQKKRRRLKKNWSFVILAQLLSFSVPFDVHPAFLFAVCVSCIHSSKFKLIQRLCVCV